MAGAGGGRLTASAASGLMAEARAGLLELGGREAIQVAAAVEGLAQEPVFRVMATASRAARPQWAGLVDDLFDRPLLKEARAGLRNALASTLTGDTLYRNVFLSFADAVILWHYAHTQERTGAARLDAIYEALRRLLAGRDHFRTVTLPPEPDIHYFERLRRIRLTQDDAYPLLRRIGRLLGAVEAEVTGEKLHPVRGSILTSYASFSAQVMATANALDAGRPAISRGDVLAGFGAYTTLVGTSPSLLRPGEGIAAG